MSLQTRLAGLITAIGADVKSLLGHVASTANPHSVTKAQVGLGAVDNTSDADKPVSTAQQTALGLKADLAGAAFTGEVSVTASGTEPALKVTQTGTGNALQIADAAGDTSPVIVDSSGCLVIGDAVAKTGVSGQIEKLQVAGDGGANSSFGLYCESATKAPNVRQYRKGVSGDGIVPPGGSLGANGWWGWDGTEYLRCAAIIASVSGTSAAGSVPTGLYFYTRSVTSEAVGMVLSSEGNLQVIGSALANGVRTSGLMGCTPTRSTVADGSTITLTNSTSHLLYDQAATIAALTVTLPSASLTDGQIITVATRSAITALTINGGTIYGAPTTLAAGGFATFIYSTAGTAWFRKG